MIEDDLVYAVGDVHGRDELLAELLTQIDVHAAARPHRLIFLCDYIDRGLASAAVVRRLMALQQDRAPGAVTCLRGNHEQMALDALAAGGGWQFNVWRRNGGDATLLSYGAPEPGPDYLDRVPSDHRAWLAGLPLLHSDAHRIYVHAGLEPHTPVADQDTEILLWIREAFLRAPPGSFPAHVVHGHTPEWAGKVDMATPELLPHRANLDTGAYATGVLTAGVFDGYVSGGPVHLLQTGGRARSASLATDLRKIGLLRGGSS